jgi:hypothetical protein
VDTVAHQEPSDNLAYPEEFLNSLIPTGMPPHEQKLKVGAIIMLYGILCHHRDSAME